MGINEISNRLAKMIVAGLQEQDPNREKVIAYGIFAMIHTIISILSVVVIGGIFGIMVEALIVSFSIAILRKAAGGAHMSEPEWCAIMGTFIAVLFGAISKWININVMGMILIGMVIFGGAYYWIYKLAPVDSKAKPIRNPEKKKLLKKKSIFILNVYVIIEIIMIILVVWSKNMNWLKYGVGIYLGVIWEVFTLTATGHKILGKIDNSLRYYIKKDKKGENTNEK